jgi:hypothetical protein
MFCNDVDAANYGKAGTWTTGDDVLKIALLFGDLFPHGINVAVKEEVHWQSGIGDLGGLPPPRPPAGGLGGGSPLGSPIPGGLGSGSPPVFQVQVPVHLGL